MAAECEPESLRRLRVTLECLASRIPEIALQRVEQVYPALQQDSVRSVTVLETRVPELIVNKTEDCKVKLQQAEESYPTLTPDLIPDIWNEWENSSTGRNNAALETFRLRQVRRKQPEDAVSLAPSVSKCQKLYTCKICNKSMQERSSNSHMKIHSGIYSCKVCGTSFSCNALVKVHERIHSNERPFACNQCEKTFKLKSSLTVHIQRHNGILKRFFCYMCKKSYEQESHLRKHLSSMGGETKYSCRLCPKVFTSKQCLIYHIPEHFDHENGVEMTD